MEDPFYFSPHNFSSLKISNLICPHFTFLSFLFYSIFSFFFPFPFSFPWPTYPSSLAHFPPGPAPGFRLYRCYLSLTRPCLCLRPGGQIRRVSLYTIDHGLHHQASSEKPFCSKLKHNPNWTLNNFLSFSLLDRGTSCKSIPSAKLVLYFWAGLNGPTRGA
jgi:hypothetical protein